MATPQTQTQPQAVSIAKFARMFGIGEATVYRHLKNGLLEYKVIGQRRLVLIPPTQRGPFQRLKPGPKPGSRKKVR
jgi:hypothetical protein